jgi:hypothetical protein
MNKLYTILALLVSLSGCIKSAEIKIQTDLVTQAITTGQWKVTYYLDNNTDKTASFSVYLFQFKTNSTVDAINNGTLESTGSWSANATDRTITSNFSNGSSTLQLLNGTWLITNSTWTSVEATLTVNGVTKKLRLNKA